MNYDAFFDYCDKITPENEKQYRDAFYNQVKEVFADNNLAFEDITNISRLFFTSRGPTSKAQFFRRKKFVVRLYDWLLENGHIDANTYEIAASVTIDDIIKEAEFSEYFFSSLDSALGYVRQVGNYKGFTGENDLLAIRSFVILAWNNVSVGEMSNLKSADFNIPGHSLAVGNRVIMLEPRYFKVLSEFSQLRSYRAFASGKTLFLRYSQYLFRTPHKEQSSESVITAQVRRFNDVAKSFGKTLDAGKLKLNGMFEKVKMMVDCGTKLSEAIKIVMECDKSGVYGYTPLYHKWETIIGKD